MIAPSRSKASATAAFFAPAFSQSLITATVTVVLDFLFHYFLTRPLETLTYFVIKFFLAFFIAAALFSSRIFVRNPAMHKVVIPATALLFSTLMSMYYRVWELFEEYAPLGSRAPDIIGIPRENLLLFSSTWWIGHAAFFAIGAVIAAAIVQQDSQQ